MNKPGQLEQIYESYYISPETTVVNLTPNELLSAFEEAAEYEPEVYVAVESVIVAISNNGLISESSAELDTDSRTYAFAVEKLVRYYNEGKDEKFNSRFKNFLEAVAGTGTPPVIPTTPGSSPAPRQTTRNKPGFWSKAGNWLKKAAKGVGTAVGSFAGGVKSGYQGTTGTNTQNGTPTATATPTQKAVNKQYPGDLSTYAADKATNITADQGFSNFGLSQNEISAIEKGSVLNITDKNGNIIQYRLRNGLLSGLKVGGPAAPAPAAPAPAAPAPAAPAGKGKRDPKTGRFIKEGVFDVTFRKTIRNFYNE